VDQARLSVRKIREVLRLRAEGYSEREIAQGVGCARSSVQICLWRADRAGVSWPLPAELDDAALEARLYPRLFEDAVPAPLALLEGLGVDRGDDLGDRAVELGEREELTVAQRPEDAPLGDENSIFYGSHGRRAGPCRRGATNMRGGGSPLGSFIVSTRGSPSTRSRSSNAANSSLPIRPPCAATSA
jgi:hypothetical protein